MIEQSYDLEMIPHGAPLRVGVSQYDQSGRTLVFTLYAGGTRFSVPSDAAVTCDGSCPDGLGFSVRAEAAGDRVRVPLTGDMTRMAGNTPCQLTVTREETILGSANFLLQVEPAPLDREAPVLPDLTGLSMTCCAVLPLDAIARGLAFGGAAAGDLEAAGALWARAYALFRRGVPLITPTDLIPGEPMLRVAEMEAGSEGYAIRYCPILRGGSLFLPEVTIPPAETSGHCAADYPITDELLSAGTMTLSAAALRGDGVDPGAVYRVAVGVQNAALHPAGDPETLLGENSAPAGATYSNYLFGTREAPAGDFSAWDGLTVTWDPASPNNGGVGRVLQVCSNTVSRISAALTPLALGSAGLRHWSGTQAEYAALTPAADTVYLILEEEA